MELEDALGEVEFNNGIPNIKFSRVLGKIWSVALKYHFRMPPYYTLLLRSLASLEGLALAVDPNFKTFEAAYPYVVRKLLTDNSASTRRILHLVVFNRRKEFQWKKLSLFLRVGAARKLQLVGSNSQTSREYSSNGVTVVNEVSNLILRLLPSKDGVVLRRLLMIADGTSLVRALLSAEAKLYRQQICQIIADVLYTWICNASLNFVNAIRFSPQVQRARRTGNVERHSSWRLQPINHYQSLTQDRRLRVIFFKILSSARKNPILMLRVYWTSFVMLAMASAMACHRVIVTLCEEGLAGISFGRERIAVGV